MPTKEEQLPKIDNRPSAMFWRRFQKQRLARWSVRVLCFLIFVAVFGDFLANEKPLYCRLDGRTQFPVFRQLGMDLGLVPKMAQFLQMDWQQAPYQSVVFPPIPYSPLTIDIGSKYKGPFFRPKGKSWRHCHWLGTDRLGHDLLAGLIAGTRIAMLVGLISMSIAALIGVFLGALAGYFGDDRFSVSWIRLLANMAGLFLGWFYAFEARGHALATGSATECWKSTLLFMGIMAFANILVFMVRKWPSVQKRVVVPLDLLIMRGIEVMNSIPGMLLLLALVGVLSKNSLVYVMIIIGLIRWPGIARFLRGELLRVRSLGFIEAGKALGFSHGRILLRHAVPNAISPVLITIAFGMASAVLLESALSFLGIGIGENGVTWGRLLSDARHYPAAWWLAVFPGAAIFLTVTLFNLLGEGLSEAMGSE